MVDDRVALEGAEQFTVELTLPPGQPGLQLGSNQQTAVTITDNDGRNVTLMHPSTCSITNSVFDSLCSCECGVC